MLFFRLPSPEFCPFQPRFLRAILSSAFLIRVRLAQTFRVLIVFVPFMTLEPTIHDVIARQRQDRFQGETSVSQGIVPATPLTNE